MCNGEFKRVCGPSDHSLYIHLWLRNQKCQSGKSVVLWIWIIKSLKRFLLIDIYHLPMKAILSRQPKVVDLSFYNFENTSGDVEVERVFYYFNEIHIFGGWNSSFAISLPLQGWVADSLGLRDWLTMNSPRFFSPHHSAGQRSHSTSIENKTATCRRLDTGIR